MQTILLIECDPTNLVAQSLVLYCFGYTVQEASSPGEVWNSRYEHRGPRHPRSFCLRRFISRIG
jgi:hypothetical protein